MAIIHVYIFLITAYGDRPPPPHTHPTSTPQKKQQQTNTKTNTLFLSKLVQNIPKMADREGNGFSPPPPHPLKKKSRSPPERSVTGSSRGKSLQCVNVFVVVSDSGGGYV